MHCRKGGSYNLKNVGAVLATLAFALTLGGNAAAQTDPTLSVVIPKAHVVEGQTAQVTFRLSAVATEDVQFCFRAQTMSRALTWNLSDPAPSPFDSVVVLNRTIAQGEQELTLNLTTINDNRDAGGVSQVLLGVQVIRARNRTDCTDNYTIGELTSDGQVNVWDAEDYYDSLTVSVAGVQTSVDEGADAEFEFTQHGGITDSGSVVVAPGALPLDVQFNIREQGTVFDSYAAEWRPKGGTSYAILSAHPHSTATARVRMLAGTAKLTLQVKTLDDEVPDVSNTAVSVNVLATGMNYDSAARQRHP